MGDIKGDTRSLDYSSHDVEIPAVMALLLLSGNGLDFGFTRNLNSKP